MLFKVASEEGAFDIKLVDQEIVVDSMREKKTEGRGLSSGGVFCLEVEAMGLSESLSTNPGLVLGDLIGGTKLFSCKPKSTESCDAGEDEGFQAILNVAACSRFHEVQQQSIALARRRRLLGCDCWVRRCRPRKLEPVAFWIDGECSECRYHCEPE